MKYLLLLVMLAACANNVSDPQVPKPAACGQQDVFLPETQLFVNYINAPVKLTPPLGSYTFASVTNDLQTSPITVYVDPASSGHQVKPGDTFNYTYQNPLPFIAVQQDLDNIDFGTGVAVSMTYCPSKS